MRLPGVVLAGMLVAGSAAYLNAAEDTSAVGFARSAQLAFRVGDYKKSTKLYGKAVRLDPSNADYRNGLADSYERQAEASSFPILLEAKARKNYARALQLQPTHVGAITGLIELNQQPIGLCEGNLNESEKLINRLAAVDPDAAKHEHEYLLDAQKNAARPGQQFLCGPVKVSRAITNHVLPSQTVQAATPAPAETVLAGNAIKP